MPLVISLIIYYIDPGPLGIEYNLGILLKTNLLRIILVQIKLIALDFLRHRQGLMGRIYILLMIEYFLMLISFKVFQQEFAFHFLEVVVDYQ